MEYRYTLDEDNNVTIYWDSTKCTQKNNPETLMPFTKEEADAWVLEAIEKLKNNNDRYSADLFVKKITQD